MATPNTVVSVSRVKHKRGRPKGRELGSYRDMARRVDMSPSEIWRAKAHVRVIEWCPWIEVRAEQAREVEDAALRERPYLQGRIRQRLGRGWGMRPALRLERILRECGGLVAAEIVNEWVASRECPVHSIGDAIAFTETFEFSKQMAPRLEALLEGGNLE